jgi:light-regulated signal transduction histidine kinase (bacteriophytochrome)
MQALVNDLLSYSRVTTKGVQFQPTDCNSVLRNTLRDLRAAVQEAGASVTYDPLPTVLGDERQLGQVFQNLISNAIKFRSDQPPRVHVSAQKNGDEWVFSVSDNGIGIEPEYFDRVFGVFQRLGRREDYPGTGIGLAVCKKIVERHGGKIWVKQSQPGKGSTFCFALPLPKEASNDQPS